MKAALYCCLFLLVGCVSEPAKPLRSIDVAGRVLLPVPLTRAAYVTLQLYAVQDGQARELARQRYRVDMLPLRFNFRLDAEDWGELMLGGALSWGEGAVKQALSSQSVSPDHEAVMVLTPLPCFPRCNGGGAAP